MSFQVEFLAALAIGFFGSLHCLGMCGPIALITPSLYPGSLWRIISGLIYNSGRIVTYTILGGIIGTLGKGLGIFKWQQGISLTIGIIILISVFLPSMINSNRIALFEGPLNSKIKSWMSRFLKRNSFAGILSIGLANGLLPCGLVYLGLAGSLDMSNTAEGALFMFFFGIGTVPMMTGIHLMGNNLKDVFRKKIARLVPVFIGIMGLLFILRGLGLGIPYVSPSMNPHTGDINCNLPSHRHPD